MATTLQHACNRKSDTGTDSSIFRNDSNNVAALQTARIQKKLMEEAARLQQQKLDEANNGKTQVETERDALSREKQSLTKTLEETKGEVERLKLSQENLARQKEDELGALKSLKQAEIETVRKEKQDELEALGRAKQGEIEAVRREKQNEYDALKTQKEGELATEKQNLGAQLNSMTALEAQRRGEINGLNQTINALKLKLPNDRQDNCLPFQYHNATVMILQLESGMALDCAKDSGHRGQTFTADMYDNSQLFRLTKNGSQPDQNEPWAITRIDTGLPEENLYFDNDEEDWDLRLEHTSNLSGWQGWWYIGRGASDRVGSWV
ncbi:hypothetical protein NW762_010477 [Fusarium torreyae]|uniref:Uncharacterized protein n=1 Tax=Fusarium torreyae TaxID=1237075 RepID=A0A9W8RTJ6_9HYPO|nr:hypothetical protein NW762_010477 [Fusarium torreyae]